MKCVLLIKQIRNREKNYEYFASTASNVLTLRESRHFQKLILAQMTKNDPPFSEPGASLLCSQQSTATRDSVTFHHITPCRLQAFPYSISQQLPSLSGGRLLHSTIQALNVGPHDTVMFQIEVSDLNKVYLGLAKKNSKQVNYYMSDYNRPQMKETNSGEALGVKVKYF